MDKEPEKLPSDQGGAEEEEALELVLFQVSECYVYLVSFRRLNLFIYLLVTKIYQDYGVASAFLIFRALD